MTPLPEEWSKEFDERYPCLHTKLYRNEYSRELNNSIKDFIRTLLTHTRSEVVEECDNKLDEIMLNGDFYIKDKIILFKRYLADLRLKIERNL